MSPASDRQKTCSPTCAAVAAVLAAIAIGGCSATKPPAAVLSNAELNIRAADEAKAAEFAPEDLKKAQDKLERARQAMNEARYDEARRLAERAAADGELAEARAEARFMRRAADQFLRKAGAVPSQAELDSRAPLSAPPAKR